MEGNGDWSSKGKGHSGSDSLVGFGRPVEVAEEESLKRGLGGSQPDGLHHKGVNNLAKAQPEDCDNSKVSSCSLHAPK